MKTKYLIIAVLLGSTLILFSCGELAYYGQAISGQWRLLELRRPLQDTLTDPSLAPELRMRLATAGQLRDFASRKLLLPDNNSYKSYADLRRDYVVRNIFATPELSLKLQSWCFPVAGCVSYRGYFNAESAERFAQQLRAQNMDVYIAKVPAYSTLGWFDDPLLNTFIHWPEGRLAELLFHELAHQQLYVPNDTIFNESFATAVGQIGAQLWLQNKPRKLAAYRRRLRYRETFIALVADAKSQLEQVYRATDATDSKREKKQRLFRQLKNDYEKIKQQSWNGYPGYDRWFNQDLNNAKLAAVNSYTYYAPAFKQMFADAHEDFAVFYGNVKVLSELPKHEREQRLRALLSETGT